MGSPGPHSNARPTRLSTPPTGSFPADARRRLFATGLDLGLSVAAFFALLFGGSAIYRLAPVTWSAFSLLPGVLWLALLLALAWRGQTPGQSLLRLAWVRRDGGRARWRVVGEPAFWVAVLPALLIWWSALVGPLLWMLCWPVYALLWRAGLRNMFFSNPSSLAPMVPALAAIALALVWARRRRAAWLVLLPVSGALSCDEPLLRGQGGEDHPTRRPVQHASFLGAGLVVAVLFVAAARTQGLPARAIAVGVYPQDVQVDGRTGRAFVLEGEAADRNGRRLDSGAIAIVGATGGLLGSIPLPAGPCAMALDERTRRAFVMVMRDRGHGVSVDEVVQTVDIDARAALRGATLTVATPASLRLPTAAMPVTPAGYQALCDARHIAVDEQANRVFVVNAVTYVDNTPAPFVAMLDARDGALLRKIPLPADAARIVVFPAIHRAFVSSTTGARLWMLDTRGGALLRTIPVGGAWPAMAVDRVTNRLFVGRTGAGGGGVAVVDARDGRVRRVIPTGREPLDIAADGTRGRLFTLADSGTPHHPAYTFSVLDARHDRKPRAVVVPGARAIATTVAVDERTGRVIVLSGPMSYSDDRAYLSVFDAATGALEKTTGLDYHASMLAIAPRDGRLFVGGDYTTDAPFWPWAQDNTDRGVVTTLDERIP